MNSSRRTIVVILIILANFLAPAATGSVETPLPGTCGLPNHDTTTFAFAGPGVITDTVTFLVDMGYCEIETMDSPIVQGCGSDYYSSNTGHGALELSLAQAGFHTPNATTTTLREVISQTDGRTNDPYLVQAVTAYLNNLYVDGYAFDAQSVLDGYHAGAISEGTFAWNNHGAIGQFVVPNCPLTSSAAS